MARESYVKKTWQYDPETGASGWFPVLDPITGDPVIISGEVAVDYVWGNFPMQPDDDRTDGGDTSNFGGGDGDNGWGATHTYGSDLLQTADYTVDFNNVGGSVDVPADSHINAAVNWNGYPDFIQEYPYQDTEVNVVVPDVTGLTESAANTALVAADLIKGAVTTTYVGATTVNDGKVKTQTPAADAVANSGDAVALVKYLPPTVPSVLGMTESAANTALVAAHLIKGTVTTTATGATAENDGQVKTQTPVSGGKADTGSAVALVLYAYSA